MSKSMQQPDALTLEAWQAVLREAAKEVFALMVATEVTIDGTVDPNSQADVTGMVGLAGELCGLLTIRCNAKSADLITSRMLGIEMEQASANRSDAIGEVCNMIAGNFKAKVAGLEDKCMLSVPTVITGPDYEMHSLEVGQRIEVPLDFEGEPVAVALEIRS
jgi:chemotaxis protein CheX